MGSCDYGLLCGFTHLEFEHTKESMGGYSLAPGSSIYKASSLLSPNSGSITPPPKLM